MAAILRKWCGKRGKKRGIRERRAEGKRRRTIEKEEKTKKKII